ncbi:MAG: glycosyltransferase [Tannerella sp.]|jgi:glycosyltransferase involved in cell wall biosynthesis|nr:glycosyltransferase [Tannerella sp.]
MKRILLVNKFYYPRGGDCVAVMAAEQLLKAKGHEVAVFCMQYPDNVASSWETYFPAEVSFSGAMLSGSLRAAERIFRARDVATRFTRLLNDFKPDVVHLHNIHSYLSPVVAQIARRRGLRVVWTMHDYKLICPTYSCLRAGKPCELCFKHKSGVFKHRCMKGSRAASLLAWMEALYWNRKKLERLTDRFISPSSFLKGKMVSAGFRAEQIEVLPNFMPYRPAPLPPAGKEDYYCYTGRLSGEKGVTILLEAAKRLPCPLKVIGGGPLFDSLRRQFPQTHIEFTGQLPVEELLPVVQRARFLVMPSVWYENNPFSVIEALCLGTPVLGANIGGIPELIDTKKNGRLFTPGSAGELATAIAACFRHFSGTCDFRKIAAEAQNKFSPETFYTKLIHIYGNSSA